MKKEKLFVFNPNSDMTVQELALIMQSLLAILQQALSGQPINGTEPLGLMEKEFSTLPETVKKHFVEEQLKEE